MTPKAAMLRLGLPVTSFWREIWRGVAAGTVAPVKWGKTYRFDPAEIEQLRAAHRVTSREDLRRMVDGRTLVAKAMGGVGRGAALFVHRRPQ